MKIFKPFKWRTIHTIDVLVKEKITWLFFFEITYDSVWKIIIQTTDEYSRCFITNGIRIYDYDINEALKLDPEFSNET